MAPLRNIKHETFCRKLIEASQTGKSQGSAYREAGYDCENGASEAAASRLLKTAKVQQRIAELCAPATRKTRTTVDTLAQQFDDVFNAAMSNVQLGAAGAAAAAKAKLLGFMRDRLEVGAVGSFDACQTMPELIEALLAGTSVPEALQTLATLREAIELHAATHAAIVVPRHMMPSDEAAVALRMFRPTPRNGRGN